MKIDNEFTVSVPVDRAWEALTDLEGIAPCLPGARLTGVDDGVYSGEVRIKVGPVVSEYAGTASFAEKDDTGYRAVISAKGRDSRGAGNASAVITAQLRADGERTVVTVNTDLKISGKVAQLGGGMIKEVSQKLLGQFVECLEVTLAAPAPAPAPASALAQAPAPVPAETPVVAADESRSEPRTPLRPVEAYSEPEPLDLMSLARGSVTKRLLPAAAALLLVVVVMVLRRARR